MPRSVRVAAVAVAALLGVAGCGADEPVPVAAGPGTTAGATTTTTTAAAAPVPSTTPTSRPIAEADPGSTLEPPPPVTVRSAGAAFTLEPWTYCYGNGCADGIPPADPPDVGRTDEVVVSFPLPGWSFSATFSPTGVECPRHHEVPLVAADDGTFTVTPAGPAGTYDVTLFGRGDGDLFVTFRWTTTEDGPMPEPEARLAVIADHDGRPDSYGVELMLSNLAETPADASATVTVTAADGDALTFDATLAEGCLAEGTVFWDGPDDEGLAAVGLGPPPFTYEVEVVLDGSRHTATATWPDDEILGNEPSVALTFSPPLPALD